MVHNCTLVKIKLKLIVTVVNQHKVLVVVGSGSAVVPTTMMVVKSAGILANWIYRG